MAAFKRPGRAGHAVTILAKSGSKLFCESPCESWIASGCCCKPESKVRILFCPYFFSAWLAPRLSFGTENETKFLGYMRQMSHSCELNARHSSSPENRLIHTSAPPIIIPTAAILLKEHVVLHKGLVNMLIPLTPVTPRPSLPDGKTGVRKDFERVP